jgi:Flp pilus assembly pilin Flp
MTGRLLRPARELARDCRGATAVEFAAIAPVLLTLILGLMDFSYNMYTTALLEGAIHKAARDATIEGAGGRAIAIDARVRDIVGDIAGNASIDFDRRAYSDFSDVSQPEDFTDSDGDGVCAEGEPFEDVNGNGTWDQDRGTAGTGGARDAVLYTVTVTYPRAFPFMGLLGLSETVTARSQTVLRNQPFGEQDRAVEVGNCE